MLLGTPPNLRKLMGSARDSYAASCTVGQRGKEVESGGSIRTDEAEAGEEVLGRSSVTEEDLSALMQQKDFIEDLL